MQDNTILLHGMPTRDEYYDDTYPSLSNSHWFPWLQKQLLIRGIATYTPEVPLAFAPRWDVWVREVERFDIGPDTMLVGHSCGGGFWLRYLSERPELKVGKVVLVAPWLDPDGDETGDFFEYTMDRALVARTAGLTVFHSSNDMGNVHKSVALIRDNIDDVQYREIRGAGHFTLDELGSERFPELLEVLASGRPVGFADA